MYMHEALREHCFLQHRNDLRFDAMTTILLQFHGDRLRVAEPPTPDCACRSNLKMAPIRSSKIDAG